MKSSPANLISLFLRLGKEEKILATTLAISVFITLLHFLLHPVRVLGMSTSIFYMDEKVTLAAFYTSVVAFMAGFTALTNLENTKKGLERLLAIVFGSFFIILAIDEYFEVHEYVNHVIKKTLQDGLVGDVVSLSWVFSLGIVVAAIFAMFAMFVQKEQDYRLRTTTILGLYCFFWILLLELMGASTYGINIYLYFVGVEEMLEMVSVCLFLYVARKKYLRHAY